MRNRISSENATLQNICVLIDIGEDKSGNVELINKVLRDHELDACRHRIYEMEDGVHVKLELYPPFHDVDVMEAMRDLALTLDFKYLEVDQNFTKTEFAFANESIRMSPLQLVKYTHDPNASFVVWDRGISEEQIRQYVDDAIAHCMVGFNQAYDVIEPKKRFDDELVFYKVKFYYNSSLSVQDWKKAMVEVNSEVDSHIECGSVEFEYVVREHLLGMHIAKKVNKNGIQSGNVN